MALVLCASCNRHVRALAAACPFCGGVSLSPSGPPEVMPAGGNRAQIFLGALAVAAVAGASACNKQDPPHPESTIVQPYGAPIPTDPDASAPRPVPPPQGSTPVKPPSPSGAYGAPPKPG